LPCPVKTRVNNWPLLKHILPFPSHPPPLPSPSPPIPLLPAPRDIQETSYYARYSPAHFSETTHTRSGFCLLFSLKQKFLTEKSTRKDKMRCTCSETESNAKYLRYIFKHILFCEKISIYLLCVCFLYNNRQKARVKLLLKIGIKSQLKLSTYISYLLREGAV
jgi:hypothetical protein